MQEQTVHSAQDKPSKRGRSAFTFMEIMISIFILSMVFIFCLPFFITTKYANKKEAEVVKAAQVSQGIIDRLKKSAHALVGGTYYYQQMHTLYGTGQISTVNAAWLAGTEYDQSTSYILVEDEGGTVPPGNVAKKIMVHLEWLESHGGKSQVKTFDNISYISKPSVAFARDPSAAAPPPFSTSTSTAVTTTVSTTNATTSNATTTNATTTNATTATTTNATTATTTNATTTNITTTNATTATTTNITTTNITTTNATTATTSTSTVRTTSTMITSTSEGDI